MPLRCLVKRTHTPYSGMVRLRLGRFVMEHSANGALVVAGKSSDGSGATVFGPGVDGRGLQVRRLMQSSRLSVPVDVTFSYRRQDAP
jgi:hypothetical protein